MFALATDFTPTPPVKPSKKGAPSVVCPMRRAALRRASRAGPFVAGTPVIPAVVTTSTLAPKPSETAPPSPPSPEYASCAVSATSVRAETAPSTSVRPLSTYAVPNATIRHTTTALTPPRHLPNLARDGRSCGYMAVERLCHARADVGA